MIEVVALAGALADTGKHGQAAVLLGDIVDQLEHVDGLADAGAAEQADLAALRERHQQVDDLDARDQQILTAGLLIERRRRAMDRQMLLGLHLAAVVLRSSQHVHDAAQGGLADGHLDGRSGAHYGQPAAQTLRAAHGDRTHDTIAQLLLHFERQIAFLQLQGVVDARDRIPWKLDVDDCADDLGNLAFRNVSHNVQFPAFKPLPRRPRSRRAPW